MAEVYTTQSIVQQFLNARYSTVSNLTSAFPDITSRIERIQELIDSYCNRTWMSKQIVGYTTTPTAPSKMDLNFIRIVLPHNEIISVDKLQIYDGSSYVDWVSTKTEGRDKDYWIDYYRGIIYINTYAFGTYLYRPYNVIVDYTYGAGATATDRSKVPKAIEHAATLLVVADLLLNDDYAIVLPDGSPSTVDPMSKRNSLLKEAYGILDRYINIPIGNI